MIECSIEKELKSMKTTFKVLFIKGYYGGKAVLNVIVYLLFAIYVAYLIAVAPIMSAKVLYSIILVIALGTCLYYEYLKHFYHKMIGVLINDCDPQQAISLRNQFQKLDVFRGFKGSLIIFNTLLLMDTGQYESCLRWLNENDRFFRSSIDNLFIMYHTRLQLAWLLNDPTAADFAMNGLTKIRGTKQKKYSPLFSWDEIDGLDCLIKGRHTKALQYFLHVDREKLNQREITYLNAMLIQTYRQLGQTNRIGDYAKENREFGGKLALVK
ncbi:hypothetical protein OF390_03925 [Limosilactobacillus fermentum]|uniref:hypothetical protein n=1 Tax=Limosilactobacillus fermentum TaxID=1613 RepID=UPI0021E94FA4|nr:hypothetical protein [Limosilactobacillus fermentum]MCV3755136.1 hypothetical protein [Limosilactobacillus fermentum]